VSAFGLSDLWRPRRRDQTARGLALTRARSLTTLCLALYDLMRGVVAGAGSGASARAAAAAGAGGVERRDGGVNLKDFFPQKSTAVATHTHTRSRSRVDDDSRKRSMCRGKYRLALSACAEQSSNTRLHCCFTPTGHLEGSRCPRASPSAPPHPPPPPCCPTPRPARCGAARRPRPRSPSAR
jgi:hypothetical protein